MLLDNNLTICQDVPMSLSINKKPRNNIVPFHISDSFAPIRYVLLTITQRYHNNLVVKQWFLVK